MVVVWRFVVVGNVGSNVWTIVENNKGGFVVLGSVAALGGMEKCSNYS